MSVEHVIELVRRGEFDKKYKDTGLVHKKEYNGFVLLNYTDHCMKEEAWDDVTRWCRGLILDTRDWSVAAFPFPKFFGIEESEETRIKNLPQLPFFVMDKIDGFFGILWRDRNGTKRIASRGSFESEMAKQGTEFFRELPNTETIPEELTFIFEIVYKQKGVHLVVYYSWEGLVLLGIINRFTGEELSFADVEKWGRVLGVQTPQTFEITTLEEVLKQGKGLPEGLEGYVIRFSNDLRVKLKSDWYRQVAKILMHFSEDHVIEALCEGRFQSLLSDFPEEIWEDALKIALPFLISCYAYKKECMEWFENAPKESRKEFALWVQDNVPFKLRAPQYLLFSGSYMNWLDLARKSRAWK